jgi:phage terminase large subunit-like protein
MTVALALEAEQQHEREIRIRLPRPHALQRQVLKQQKRYNVVACGRQWGKTTLGVSLAVRCLLEEKRVGWFSPTYKDAMDVWRELKQRLLDVARDKSESEHRLELVTGGVFELWTLDDPDNGRGRQYDLVIIDEAAKIRKLEQAWTQTVQPTLLVRRGGAWFLSTPKGRNYFFRLWQSAQVLEEWAGWHFKTADTGLVPLSEIEEARKLLPQDAFRQEYEAEFLEDGGVVFRNLDAVCVEEALAAGIHGCRYVMGVDWGKHNDFTVFTVFDVDTKKQVYVERMNQIDYHLQIQRLLALYERFRPTHIVAERNAMGEVLVEMLQRQNLPVVAFSTTAASKTQIIEALMLAVEQKSISLLNDPAQRTELESFEIERLPSGSFRYAAPPGMHDDMVIALALAWWGVNEHMRLSKTDWSMY